MSDNGKVPAIHDLNVRANELACENDTLVNRVKVLEEGLKQLALSESEAVRNHVNKLLESDNG